ncbi:hypothetical protein [Chryseobacterium defluvii]|uniref:Uncharacterized protein n=1 Tax=Chryseobacterium defluvii TaxID=160396 RepID=A0A495SL77_9FLAO|nr:hypothetical protein [Chryseobacterium defluvii]RKT01049.1 hypothetical protein BCF58_0260 [Chryseobacterium defluvii]
MKKFNVLRAFSRAKVFPKNQKYLGKIFIKSIKESDNADAANEILLAAYMLKLPNYFEIEDEFHKKFPIKFSKT